MKPLTVALRTLLLVVVSLAVVFPGATSAQNAWKANSPPSVRLDEVALAKVRVRDGREVVSFVYYEYGAEERAREVMATKMVSEVRTRTVLVDGREVKRHYTVEVPIQESREITYLEYLPSRQRLEVPIEEVGACDLSGRQLSSQEIFDRLQNPTHVVVAYDLAEKADPFYASVLKDDVLLVSATALTEAFFPAVAENPMSQSSRRRDLPAMDQQAGGGEAWQSGNGSNWRRTGSEAPRQVTRADGDPLTAPPRGFLVKSLKDDALDAIVGIYHRRFGPGEEGQENDYHTGSLMLMGRDGSAAYEWRNKAGVRWRLQPDLETGFLHADPGSPYYDDGHTGFQLLVYQDRNGRPLPEIAGFVFQDEVYWREEAPADHYDPVVEEIEGWRVHFDPQLIDGPHEEEGRAVYDSLVKRLRRVKRVVSPSALHVLQQTGIWVEHQNLRLGIAQYHPSVEWLTQNGHDPRLAQMVHFPEAKKLTEPIEPFEVVLHELSHAYQDQTLGYGNQELADIYRAAMASGRYDSVQRFDGERTRHYAATNPEEYFAEGSEAFLLRNDFFPFTRNELRRHDPELEALLARAWGGQYVRPSGRRAPGGLAP